ncbi:MAG: TIGR01906 family membrane protein [archaeon]
MKIKNITLIILIPILILLGNFAFLAFNENYYKEQYIKNNVYTRIPKEEVDKATTELSDYLQFGKEMQSDYFNEKEKLHLKDVRQIIRILLIILYIAVMLSTIIIIISYAENKKLLGMSIIGGSLLTIALIILAFIILQNFEYAFIKFHEILFTNDLWLLNPRTDKLIVMFPENFFYDITQDIAFRSLLTAIATTAIGWLLLLGKKTKHHSKVKRNN